MGVVNEIRERAKQLRGDDTESLLKKLNDTLTKYSKDELDLQKRRERREITLYKRATVGGTSNVYNSQNIVYNTNNNSGAGRGGNFGSRKIETTDREGLMHLQGIQGEIQKQSKDQKTTTSKQTRAFVKAFLLNEALKGLTDRKSVV